MLDIIKVPDDKRIAIIDFDLNVERDFVSVRGFRTTSGTNGRALANETFTLNADFEMVFK